MKTKNQRSRASLKKEADTRFSRAIKMRDKRCQAIGYKFKCSFTLQAAHLIRRRYFATRWSLDNAVALCGAHHVYFTHNDIEWIDWIIERIGEAEYRELRERAKAGFIGSPDYEAIIKELS